MSHLHCDPGVVFSLDGNVMTHVGGHRFDEKRVYKVAMPTTVEPLFPGERFNVNRGNS